MILRSLSAGISQGSHHPEALWSKDPFRGVPWALDVSALLGVQLRSCLYVNGWLEGGERSCL